MKKICTSIFLTLPVVLFTTSFILATNIGTCPTIIPSNLDFVENKGQWDDFIHFKAELGMGSLYLEDDRFTFYLIDPKYIATREHGIHQHEEHTPHDELVNCHAYHINFLHTSGKKKYTATKKQIYYRNYFLGNEPSKWASYVGVFKKVSYTDLFEGITLDIYGNGANLKYDFIVQPYADASNIQLEYEGVDKISLRDGKLHLLTSVNEIIEQKPIAYQIIDNKRVEVPCNYVLKGNVVSYDFPTGYDKDYQLVIDPTLVFASFTGSTADNWGFTATYDLSGSLYGGGAAFGTGYPTTTGAFQTAFGGSSTDIAISKFTPSGNQLIYSTYLGGSRSDIPHSMIVNNAGQLVVYGATSSGNFPTTANAFDRNFNGGNSTSTDSQIPFSNGSDIILTVFTQDGSGIIGSTYLGGSANDGLNTFTYGQMNYGDTSRGEVLIDNSNNIYLASTTFSADFPTTSGVFSPSYSGGKDGCIVKMSFDLSSLLWGTYLGGTGEDAAFSIKLDDNNNVLVCGYTKSTNFPTTPGTIHPSLNGGEDGFIIKINPNATSVIASSYLGTGSDDRAYFVELDEDGYVYVTGQSDGGNYPVTENVYSNPGSKQFLHKLKPDLTETEFSTTFGTSITKALSPTAFLVDVCNRIYISGWGGSINGGSVSGMPLTSNAFQSSTDGNDFYFIVFSPDAVDLEYATYFGGSTSREHVDGGTSRFDKKGVIYQAVCAGCGGNSDFPTTPGAYSRTNNSSNCNLGVIKFDMDLPLLIAEAQATPEVSGCAPFEVNFANWSTGATHYFWDFADGSTSTEETPTHVFTDAGNYEVMLVASGDERCVENDTTYLSISVLNDSETHNFSLVICPETPITLYPSFGLPGADYLWQNGSTASNLTISGAGVYSVTTSLSGCHYVDIFTVTLNDFGGITDTNYDICEGGSIELFPDLTNTDYLYQWLDGSSADHFLATTGGDYWVTTSSGGCIRTNNFHITEHNAYHLIDEYDICEGDSILWHGNYYSETSNDSLYFSTRYGCDSTFALRVIKHPNYADTVEITVCKNEIFTLPDGTTTSETGYFDSYLLSRYSCDSIVTTVLGNFPVNEYFVILEDSLNTRLGYSVNIHTSTDIPTDSIHWTPSSSLNCDYCPWVVATPYQQTMYYASTFDTYGCPVSDSILVKVDDTKAVYIPNAFSPNGDGSNDLFRIYTDKGVRQINNLKIFDRWGDCIYDYYNLDPFDDTLGWWDGKYRGKFLNPAVFVYMVEVAFLNGEVRVYSGDVTLVK